MGSKFRMFWRRIRGVRFVFEDTEEKEKLSRCNRVSLDCAFKCQVLNKKCNAEEVLSSRLQEAVIAEAVGSALVYNYGCILCVLTWSYWMWQSLLWYKKTFRPMSANAVLHLGASAVAIQLYSYVMDSVCGKTNCVCVRVCSLGSKTAICRYVYSLCHWPSLVRQQYVGMSMVYKSLSPPGIKALPSVPWHSSSTVVPGAEAAVARPGS